MKNSFIVKLAVELFFTAFKANIPALAPVIAFLQPVLAFFLERLLGAFADWGILNIDLTLDTQKIALERKEYHEAAEKAYAKATARVYTAEEKRAIRTEYLEILAKFGRISGAAPKP